MARFVVGLVGAWLALSAWIAPASAHASLVAADPADAAVVALAPRQFLMTFSEPVSPLVLSLISPDDSSTKLDRFTLRDRTLEIEAPKDLGNGTHVLAWRVVSEDGHPVGGSVIFSVGAPNALPPVVSETIDWPVRSGLWAAKVLMYLGLFLGVGGVFATAWLAQGARAGRNVALAFVGLGFVAAPISIGFQGLDALGAPLGHLADEAVWRAGFGTSLGRTAVIAMLAFGMALLAFAAKGMIARILALLAMIGTGSALAASGHAGAAEPQWLTRPMVFLHGFGIAFWSGALIPLGLALKRGTPDAADALRRFSRTIPFVMAALIVAGVVLAVIQIGQPAALIETAYGQVFLIKLALLAGLFTLAAVNRWTLTTPTAQGDASATRRLARFIAAETAIVILIFGVAALWRFTPPPRALAIAAAQPASIHIHTAKAMADLSITPGRTGPVEASIMIMTGDFGPLDAKQVTLVLSNPAAGIEPIKRPAARPGDGTWRIDDLIVPLPGKWTVRIDILISDFEIARLHGEVNIRP